MARSGSQAAQGAIGGAATGAALGSVIPGVGTLVGGGVGALAGGLAGYFGGDPERYTPDPNAARLENAGQLRGFGRRVLTPAISGRSVAGPGAQAQTQLLSRLGQIATGEQMGAGEMAARRQGATAIANQAGQAMGARGIGASAVAANAARNAAMLGTEVAGRAGESALGDQAAANQLLGSVAGQNVAQQLQARGMDDAQAMAALDYLARLDMAEQQGRLAMEPLRAQSMAGNVGLGTQLLDVAGTAVPLALDYRAKLAGARAA